MTSRVGRFWTVDDSTSEAYATTGRNPAWEYDPDGRLVSRNEAAPDSLPYEPLRVSYDAAGRPCETTQATSRRSPLNRSLVFTTRAVLRKSYDGDGAVVKEEKEGGTTLYLRSSALGGQAVAEYGASGARLVSNVVAGGVGVAREEGAALYWRQANPVTGDEVETTAAGAVATKAVLDPTGVAVGDNNPFEPPGDGGGEGEGMSQARINSRYAQLLPPSLGGGAPGASRCRVSGFELGCGSIASLAATGIITPGSSRSFAAVYGRSEKRYVGFAHWDANAAAAGVGIGGASPGGIVRNSPNAGWLWMGLSFSSADGGQVTGAGASPLPLDAMRYEPGLYPLDGEGEPQNPTPQPPPDVPGIRSELERMLKDPKCADFIKDLLGRVVSDKNPLVEGGDIIKIFNLINSPAQGGMVRAGAPGSMQGIGYGGNYALGSVGTGDARIQIGTSHPGLPTARSDAGTALHETIHHAGRNVYLDRVLAEAVRDMTGRAIIRHDGAPLTGDPRKDVGIYSTFWNMELQNRCK